MDKKTLLKASAIIGGDLSSHSTGSFKGFYSSDQPLSPPILVSPMQSGNKQLQSPLGLQDVADPENMSRYIKINYNNIIVMVSIDGGFLISISVLWLYIQLFPHSNAEFHFIL